VRPSSTRSSTTAAPPLSASAPSAYPETKKSRMDAHGNRTGAGASLGRIT
jgi:hypothetical protein